MEKQIVFTLSPRQYGMRWTTKSLLADESDKVIDTVALAVAHDMEFLTKKYNKKGISVLFESN